MEPRKEEKQSRFQIEKLEERIAPIAQAGLDHGGGHGNADHGHAHAQGGSHGDGDEVDAHGKP